MPTNEPQQSPQVKLEEGNPRVEIPVSTEKRIFTFLDVTPDPPWSWEEFARWIKTNLAAAVILFTAFSFLTRPNISETLRTFCLTAGGATLAVLLGPESVKTKK